MNTFLFAWNPNRWDWEDLKESIAVCPNCHAMIHSKRPAFTIEEIKEIIK